MMSISSIHSLCYAFLPLALKCLWSNKKINKPSIWWSTQACQVMNCLFSLYSTLDAQKIFQEKSLPIKFKTLILTINQLVEARLPNTTFQLNKNPMLQSTLR